ncbi:MAG: hypothetical protein ACR2PL_26420 [Dehalococcoidia bacterium]
MGEAEVGRGLLVDGTRLTLFLPVNTSAEALAAASVVSQVRQRYRRATHSTFQPPAFPGYWFDERGDLVVDEISLVVVDVPRDLADTSFVSELEAVRVSIFEAYRSAGSPQDEVWLMVQPVERVG